MSVCKTVCRNIVINQNGTYYVKAKYAAASDLVIVVGRGGGNVLPDIRNVYTVSNDAPLNCALQCDHVIIEHSTDMIGPSIVRAVEHADGDNVCSRFFTGGNHQDNNKGSGGSATARCAVFTCLCDGMPITEQCAGDEVLLSWTNFLQGYNTTVIGGNGREILREDVKMLIRGTSVSVDIQHTALEDIVRETYYGLQMVSLDFAALEYVEGRNSGLHPTRERSNCGDQTCRRILLTNAASDFVETGIYEEGLGIFLHNKADHSAFNMQYGKCYFNLIRNTEYLQHKDEVTATKGYYHFYTQ